MKKKKVWFKNRRAKHRRRIEHSLIITPQSNETSKLASKKNNKSSLIRTREFINDLSISSLINKSCSKYFANNTTNFSTLLMNTQVVDSS